MPRCSGSKPDGSPCERIVGASQSYCYSHDPARSKERHRAASKAARSKPSKELSEVKRRLRELAEDVISGRIDRADAAVAGQLYGTYLRALSVELQITEHLELSREVEELRDALESRRERKWG
jgi:hypothetical protein